MSNIKQIKDETNFIQKNEDIKSEIKDNTNIDTDVNMLKMGTPMQEEWNELFSIKNDYWENKKIKSFPQTTEKSINISNIRDDQINGYPTISSTLTNSNEEPGKIKRFVAKICQMSKSMGILKLCKSKRLVEKRKNSYKNKEASELYANKSHRIKNFKDLVAEKKRKIMEKSKTSYHNNGAGNYNPVDKKLFVKTKTSILGGFKSAISGILSVGNMFAAEKISEPSSNLDTIKNRKRKFQVKRRIHKKDREE